MPRHQVKVLTWATKDKDSNGMDNFLDQELFGGNVGHASINMTLPINKETSGWIEKYCMEKTFEEYKKTLPVEEQETLTFQQYLEDAKERIPISKKTNIIKAVEYDDTGNLIEMAEPAYEEEFFEIDFSWWPDDELPFSLSMLEIDMFNEREGVHFEYDSKWKEYLRPESRIHRGKLGQTRMDYAPHNITHQRDLSNKDFSDLNASAKALKLEELLEIQGLINGKVKKIENFSVEDGSLKLMLQNIGLDSFDLATKFRKTHPDSSDIEEFKKFIEDESTSQIDKLTKEQQVLSEIGENIELMGNQYATVGRPPDHVVSLPYMSDTNRGLSPEAMLETMRELTELSAPKFDLHRKNCSKTTIDILAAGAAHDPLLQNALKQEALGFYGTPQQVLSNAKNAENIIKNDQKNTLMQRIQNFSPLKKAMGALLEIVMDEDASKLARRSAGVGAVLVGIARVPVIVFKSLLDPQKAMGDVANFVKYSFNKDSNLLKSISIAASIIPMIVLSPFAAVQAVGQGIKGLASAVQNLLASPESKSESMDEITTPLASEYAENSDISSTAKALNLTNNTKNSTRTILANMVNDNIATKVNDKTLELHINKSPMEILTEFEIALEDITDHVVTLSTKDFNDLNQYVLKENNPVLTARFQTSCDESLDRANRLGPKSTTQVDEIIEEVLDEVSHKEDSSEDDVSQKPQIR